MTRTGRTFRSVANESIFRGKRCGYAPVNYHEAVDKSGDRRRRTLVARSGL